MEENHWPEEFNKIADYLSGEATKEERLYLELWLKEKPENLIYFEKVKKVWQASAVSAHHFQPDISKAWEKAKPQSRERAETPLIAHRDKKTVNVAWYLSIAASILLIFVFGIAVLFFNSQGEKGKLAMEVKEVSLNEKGEVLLSDGSQVWVNSQSKFYYPEEFEEKRVVYLEGEAYFEVEKNPEKPFIIHSGKGVIEVLGTSFNVLQKKETLEINVIEGSVALFSEEGRKERIVLQKGDKGVLLKNGSKLIKEKISNSNFLSWHTGVLVFENATLETVSKDLSKHFNKNITISDKTDTACRLSATFNNKTLEEAFEIIELTMGAEVKKSGDKYMIESKTCR